MERRLSLALPGLLYAGSTLAMLAYMAAWIGPGSVAAALLQPGTLHSLALSVVVASVVSTAAIALAVPVAYGLSRGTLPLAGLLEPLLMVPFGMPPVAIGALLLLFLAGPARPLEELLGILYTPKGLVLAQFMVVYPVAIRTLKAGFDAVPFSFEAVARSLGYSWAETMARVVLPHARRGVAAAAVLSFSRALGEFGASVMVAGITEKTMTLPIAIYSYVGGGDFTTGYALVLVSAAAALLGAYTVSRLED